MKTEFQATRVTVYVGETDRVGGKPLYSAIVELLHAEGMAGASATRGMLGYGASGRTHSAHLLDVSEDLPVSIVFVDAPDKVEAVMIKLDGLIESGLVVTESVQAARYAK